MKTVWRDNTKHIKITVSGKKGHHIGNKDNRVKIKYVGLNNSWAWTGLSAILEIRNDNGYCDAVKVDIEAVKMFSFVSATDGNIQCMWFF